MQTINKKKETR